MLEYGTMRYFVLPTNLRLAAICILALVLLVSLPSCKEDSTPTKDVAPTANGVGQPLPGTAADSSEPVGAERGKNPSATPVEPSEEAGKERAGDDQRPGPPAESGRVAVAPARPRTPVISDEPPPTALEPRKVGDFELPRIDLVGLSLPMRAEVAAAYEAAATEPEDSERIGELGMYYYAVGNALDAISCFERAAKRQPDVLRWWYFVGLAYKATYNTDNAILALEKAIAVDEKFTPAKVELADLLQRSNPGKALALYTKALELAPKDARVHLGLGELAMQEKDYEKAEKHLKDSLELAPKYAAANGAMGRLLEATGRSADAGRFFEIQKAGGQPPLVGDPLIIELLSRAAGGQELLILAERLARAGEVNRAIVILQRAIQKNESELSVRHALGVLLGIRGFFSEAAQEFRTVLQKNPYQFNTMVDLSKALMCLGNYDEAESLLKEVLSSGSNDSRAVLLFGNLLLERGRVEDATRYLQGLSKARPDHRETRLALAKSLTCLEKYDAAIEEYRKAGEIDAGDPITAEEFVWELARLMADQRRGIPDGAGGRIALRPEHLDRLGKAFKSVGMAEEATALEDYVGIVAKNAALLARAGSFVEAERYAQVGISEQGTSQTPRIVELLRQETAAHPDKAGLRHLLALILSATGNKTAAVVEWRQLLGQKPGFEPAYVAWSVDLLVQGKYAEAQELLREGLMHRKESPLLANALAWALATAPRDADRKPDEAVRWAEFACERTDQRDPELLDTLAAAYSAAGRFPDAVRVEQEAIKLATQMGQKQSAAAYRKRLDLYTRGEAYREGLR